MDIIKLVSSIFSLITFYTFHDTDSIVLKVGLSVLAFITVLGIICDIIMLLFT